MATILIIDDDPKICEFLGVFADSWGHTTDSAGTTKKGLKLSHKKNYDLVLLDLDLPDGNGLRILPDLIRTPSNPEVIIITGTGDLSGAKLAFKYGAWDYVTKPFTMEEITLPVSRALAYRKEKKKPETPVALKRRKIIGSSAVIRSCLEDVARASATDASALITGETGTGKELFARAIHENSRRSDGSFIPVDCGAIPESLAEGIFFGHERGAFTGAGERREGIIQQADGGTLFLDEIGDLPPKIQKALLRALQEKSIRPLGAKREVPVDFKLVAATNRNLIKMVAERRFREDLLFRIRALEINLPPLRDRENDIEEITISRIHQMCQHYETGMKGISPEFMKVLTAHHWPGNVRELINVLEYALASVATDPTIHPKHLPPEYRTVVLEIRNGQDRSGTLGPDHQDLTVDEFPTFSQHRSRLEKAYLDRLIQIARGDREKACSLSGVSQSHLYGLLKKYGLTLS